MTRQTWTAFLSAILFVGFAVLLSVVPVPFVSWSPGQARDVLAESDAVPVVDVSGIDTHPTSGRLDMTVVSVTPPDGRLSLPQALLAYWLPNRDALPRDVIYPPGASVNEVEADELNSMRSAQEVAVVAALREDRQPVTELPRIASVTVGGPSHKKLLPGDLILSVDGVGTPDDDAVTERVSTGHKVGDKVVFQIVRNGVQKSVSVIASESTTRPGVPVAGVTLDTGYSYSPKVSFNLGAEVGGPSAGLVFALAVYDKITDGQLLNGAHVAGTGTISSKGVVGPIGGIQEKIAGAEAAGATVFLVPAANCSDLAGFSTDVDLVRVAKLSDAVDALQALGTGAQALVPHC